MPAPASTATRTPALLRLRLALLLFGEFAVWGLWYVSIGSWLGATLHFTGPQIGSIYGTLAIAGLVTPMIGGAIADRFAHTERMLAALHGAGGILLVIASRQDTFASLYGVILLYALCYMPTLALAPALTLRHLAAPAAEFPALRTLGTIGWIAAGIVIGLLGLELSPQPMLIAGVVSMGFGAYCLTLPATPPLRREAPRGIATLLGLDAFALLRDPVFRRFTIASLVIAVPTQFYVVFGALYLTDVRMPHPAMLLSVGQMTEVAVLLLLPLLHRRLGARRVLLLGIAAWALRSLCFALGAHGSALPIMAGLLMHGFAYGCVTIEGQLMVHDRAPEEMRASAQGLMSLATNGLGNLLGTMIAGRTVALFTTGTTLAPVRDWSGTWLVSAAIAIAALLGVLLDRRGDGPPSRTPAA